MQLEDFLGMQLGRLTFQAPCSTLRATHRPEEISMRRHPWVLTLALGIGILVPIAAAAPASAVRRGLPTLWIFPSQNCQLTLQDCVDGASPGDTIEIRISNDLGDISFSKSLTLRAGSGYHPVLDYVYITDSGSPSAVDVVLQGLTVTNRIHGFITDHPGGSLAFRGMDLQEVASSLAPALDLDLRVATTVSIEGNSIEDSQDSGAVLVSAQTPAGDLVSAEIVGNTMRGHAGSLGEFGGVDVENLGDGSLDATIDGNAISNPPTWGIVAFALSGHSVVDVVGNTVDRTNTGLLVNASRLPASTHMTLNAFDDAFTHGRVPVDISDTTPSRLTFRAGTNDLFGNTQPPVLSGHSLGAGNLKVNPRYLDADLGDLRLRAGRATHRPGRHLFAPGGRAGVVVVLVDGARAHAGHGRLAVSVDIGAFERGAGVPTGVALVGGPSEDDLTGTAGADILCGMGGGDWLRGMGGTDFLDGGAEENFIVGGSGPDRLRGGLRERLHRCKGRPWKRQRRQQQTGPTTRGRIRRLGDRC